MVTPCLVMQPRHLGSYGAAMAIYAPVAAGVQVPSLNIVRSVRRWCKFCGTLMVVMLLWVLL